MSEITAKQIIEKSWFYQRVMASDGFDESLRFVLDNFDMKIHRYPTGTRCWSWVLPPRWVIRSATLSDMNGNVLIDVKDNPLYLWAYSGPFTGTVNREELLKHIYTREDYPDAIVWQPRQMFRHWKREWGFSIPYNVLKTVNDSQYRVDIDTEFQEGDFNIVEYEVTGESSDTILLCGHWCHPAMCNDGLSGCVVGIKVIEKLRKKENLKYTYKLLLIPELVGAVAYLYHNQNIARQFKGGICINFAGTDADLVLQESMNGRSKLDRVFAQVLRKAGINHRMVGFKEEGTGDEIAFEAPGFSIPTTCLTREKYKEYHTHFDNPDIIREEKLDEVIEVILRGIDIIERDWIPQRTFVGLPCLASPELDLYINPPALSNIPLGVNYSEIIGKYGKPPEEDNLHLFMERVTNMLEGDMSVFDIAERFNLPFGFVDDYLSKWAEKGLVKRLPASIGGQKKDEENK